MATNAASLTIERMDRMYGPQKWIYDLTRAYYLLGRDQLLQAMEPRPGAVIVDVGCGTGRNLAVLAELYPDVRLIGIEPANPMLQVARQKLARRGLADHVELLQGVAEDVPAMVNRGQIPHPGHILFSYSLSIMTEPAAAVRAALDALAPGGRLEIVDFGPMTRLPGSARRLMAAWLAKFSVHHRPEIAQELSSLESSGRGKLELTRRFGGYAELMRFRLLTP